MEEPNQLKRGRVFHKKIQGDWRNDADGEVTIERGITKPTGRRGRVDILVNTESCMVALVEVKGSDWDRMTENRIRRNVARHAWQIWNYIESQLAEGKDVCPGIIFPKRPESKERMDLIEALFLEEGIPVVWDDETIEECKARNMQS